MNTKRALVAVALAASCGAFAAPTPCEQDPRARGLPERIEGIRARMDRIERTSDRDEQRVLLELNAKTMHEGLRELRRREPGEACRAEMLQAMMEQMLRHNVAASDSARSR